MAEARTRHQHLPFPRSEPVNQRRTRTFPGRKAPIDPAQHGLALRNELDGVIATPVAEPGFDPRRLLKLTVDGLAPDELNAVPGLEVVSQEGRTVVILFASDEGQREFRRRLDLLSRGAKPTRQEVLFAIRGVGDLTAEDRTGGALRSEGLPNQPEFILDIELWPLEPGRRERTAMRQAFEPWCALAGVRILDWLDQETIIMCRARLGGAAYSRVLRHRDVRLVDLPPRLQLSDSDLLVELGSLPVIPSPAPDAPTVTVLDSGIASNHPLLAPAVGDAQSFLDELGPDDQHGHGSAVAGLALYGDVSACLEKGAFAPELRILSGRITDSNNENVSQFLENQIARATQYFVESYGCRVFNLSFGDKRKPYSGGHVRGVAATLDTLSRVHQVLFVVSAGNYEGTDNPEPKWRTQYPRYLLDREHARIIDPAPALNALTVGSLARYEVSRPAQRYPNDPAYQPVARSDQPSPFSRTGPGPGGATKPDLVAYGGNYAVDLRDTAESWQRNALLGEPAPSHDFASGRLLRDFVGTSFAAPHVSYLAARILREYPQASANLLRALIAVHASVPKAVQELGLSQDETARLVGYGKPNDEHTIYSLEHCSTLMTEERLGEDQHHFYEIPLPSDFLKGGRHDRLIRVALAHTPIVRTTRIEYRGSRMSFRLVQSTTLEEVTRVFQKTKKGDREPMIKEFRSPQPGPNVRDKGTLQVGVCDVKLLSEQDRAKKLFVVVTRVVPEWARGWRVEEPYSLVTALEDRARQQVRYYQQLEVLLRQRVRVGA
jgi:hypothetical protein